MPGLPDESSEISPEVKPIEIKPVDSSNDDLQLMAKALVAQRISQLKDKVADEVKGLKDRHQRIRLMHQMLRAINDAKDSSGGIDFTKHPELLELRNKAKDLFVQAQELQKEAQKLEESGMKTEAKELREAASEMIDTASAMGIKPKASEDKSGEYEPPKDKLTKEEKEQLVEGLRMTSEDIQTLNQLQTQTVSRLNNELHESLLIGRDIMKKVHEVLSLMARGIRGG